MVGCMELFRRTAGAIMRPARVQVHRDTPCDQVARQMTELGESCAVVLDARRIRGMVRAEDLLRLPAERLSPETPVAHCLPPGPPLLVRRGMPLYQVLGLLQQQQRQQAPVVTAEGAVCGIVHERDCLGSSIEGVTGHFQHVLAGTSATTLARARERQPHLLAGLLDQGLRGHQLQEVISRLNDSIHRQAFAIARDAMEQDGWGQAPYPFALVLMGSGGRMESFLDPDQDNGLVIADYPDTEHGAVDRYFSELARRVIGLLDHSGIRLCTGNVMATNPLWRKTLTQWHRQVRGWLRSRSPQGFLHSNILLDCRGVAGDMPLARAMRGDLVAQLSGSATFVRSLTLNDSIREVGLGWFDRLITDTGESAHAGEIDLKRHGIMPIVEIARLYGLAHGLEATSTPERLNALREQGTLDADDSNALKEAHAFMAELVFRQQLSDWRAGRITGKHVAPEALNRCDREALVRSLKTSQSMVRKLSRDLAGGAEH